MVEIPVSIGELFDKITILEIKQNKIGSANIEKELSLLSDKAVKFEVPKELFDSLRKINEMLWVIEDEIRKKENEKDFGYKFIELARSVYFWNDKRAMVKKQINELMGSNIMEEKQYVEYTTL